MQNSGPAKKLTPSRSQPNLTPKTMVQTSLRPLPAPLAQPEPKDRYSPIALRVGEAYDDLAEGYDRFHIDAKSRAENRFVANRIARRLERGGRVIDVGCGTGLLLDLVSIPPDRFLGVDVSESMLEQARAKHPRHTFVRADAQKLDNAYGQFDLVVSLFGSPSYCALGPFSHSVERVRKPGGGMFLMYCGPRYVERSTYINKGAQLLQSYFTEGLRHAYPESHVWGVSCLVDLVPRRTPEVVMRRLLELDAKTVGRLRPDLCYFLVVER